ncbi:MAG: hypothetical protein JSS79_17575 [Bacteroidetes bacterium]|nr:hypothetical protein [Bacteroidota bacterium]
MQWIRTFLVVMVLILLVDSCLKQPEYNVIPEITLQDLIFKPGNINKGIQDTLKIILNFRDGDGDLGVGSADSAYRDFYNPWYVIYDTITKNTDYTVYKTATLAPQVKYITYRTRKLAAFDTLPAINCKNWEQRFTTVNGQSQVKDTVYIVQNSHAFNIFISIFEKNPDGSYSPYDPNDPVKYIFPNCNANFLQATFPNLSTDEGKKSPLDGTLKYSINSFALNSTFSIKVLKMQVYITDRAFHKSNVVEKEGFTLASITK